VSLKEVRSYKVYVLGKVAKPGVYQVPEKLTVLQALSLAGGLTPFAAPDEAVVLRRQGAVEVRYPFVYSLVLGGQVPEMNIVLASGDTVVVP
jgi:polysaccharide export outer membrane protein